METEYTEVCSNKKVLKQKFEANIRNIKNAVETTKKMQK